MQMSAKNKQAFWRRQRLAASAIAVIVAASVGATRAQDAKKPLSANDVSILFPPPRTSADLANLIALADLGGSPSAPQRLWSQADFERFISIADNPEAFGSTGSGVHKIDLPVNTKTIEAWFVAGIRIDPGAPGLSQPVVDQFGRQPQIRFIIQPVTVEPSGNIKVHDVAGHLIFSFSSPEPPPRDSCLPRSKPNDEAFKAIARDFAALRDGLAAGKFGGVKVATAGPLNVHPGLRGPSAQPFRDALKATLEKHLSADRLSSMAIMGLDFPEPWIFVAMLKTAAGFTPVPGPTLNGRQVAQMLSFRGGTHVVPVPATNNLNPVTCRHAALQNPPLPIAERKGVATAAFIDGDVGGTRIKEIVDVIADPRKSHFFNTDCVSCHTETAQPLVKDVKNFSVPGVARDVLPRESWNVRNFGWFTSFLQGGPAVPTITRRTAAETAEVVSFINKEMLR